MNQLTYKCMTHLNSLLPSALLGFSFSMNSDSSGGSSSGSSASSSSGSSSDNPYGNLPGVDLGHALDLLDKLAQPKMYKVLLLNDDFTPMDFVVHILEKFFKKSESEASHIMLEVHQKGAGLAGVFSREIAEMKVMQVNQYARMNQHPLKTTMEPES